VSHSNRMREVLRGQYILMNAGTHPDRGDHCGVCDYRYYCGGCRARARAHTGDIQAGDPGRAFNRQEWEELTQYRPSPPTPIDQPPSHYNVMPETSHELVNVLPVVSPAAKRENPARLSGKDIHPCSGSRRAEGS
jgi:hypothetical protein